MLHKNPSSPTFTRFRRMSSLTGTTPKEWNHSRQAVVLLTFGTRVRARRLSLGLSQQDLADRTGLHHTFIGHVEHGRRNLRLDGLCKLAWGLNVDLGELLEGLG